MNDDDQWYDFDDEYDEDDEGIESDFDYEAFVEDEFGDQITNTRIKPLWRVVALVLLIAFLLGTLLIPIAVLFESLSVPSAP